MSEIMTAAAPGAYRSLVTLNRRDATFRLQWFPVVCWRLDNEGEAHPILPVGSDGPIGEDEHFGATRLADGSFVGWGHRFDRVDQWLGKIVPHGFKNVSRWRDTPPAMRSAPVETNAMTAAPPFDPATFRPAAKRAAKKTKRKPADASIFD